MWLINTSTLSLELFYSDATPPYAILSHTWSHDELSFQEFRSLNADNKHKFEHRTGYHKVINTCEQAQKDGLPYIWIDTCCIDKTSSAELTEAINSMYTWYQGSEICYAHLEDVDIGNQSDTGNTSVSIDQVDATFRECRWFTRGWCLQELLAPRCLWFYDRHWRVMGQKGDLSRIISRITGIPQIVIASSPEKHIHEYPIATRISWMARRHTTRVEDMSYSLLGILDINMPMLYGEGQRAFQRLQEEVIRKYNDLSIFAWTPSTIPPSVTFIPILAQSPSDFTRDISPDEENDNVNLKDHLNHRVNTQFSLTNQGIVFPSIKLYSQHQRPPFRHHYVLYLNHRDPSFRNGIIPTKWYILLQKIGPGLFVRLHETPDRTSAFRKSSIMDPCSEPVCILTQLSAPLARQLTHWERHAVRLRWRSWPKQRQKFWHVRAVEPQRNWDRVAGQFLLEMATEQFMRIEFAPGEYTSNPGMEYFVIVIQVGDGKRRDPRRVSAHIVSSRVHEGINATPFEFAFRENLALRAVEKMGGRSSTISMVGYDISMGVEVVEQADGVPYHSVYLDWVKSKAAGDEGETDVKDLASKTKLLGRES